MITTPITTYFTSKDTILLEISANRSTIPCLYAMVDTDNNHYKYYVISIKSPSNRIKYPYDWTVNIDYGKINKPPKHAIYFQGSMEAAATKAADLIREKKWEGYKKQQEDKFNLIFVNKKNIMVTELNYHGAINRSKKKYIKFIDKKKKDTNDKRFNTLII